MAFSKYTWQDEILMEEPRYKITASDDDMNVLEERARIELNVDVVQEGTPFTASIMNNLETRIDEALKELEQQISSGITEIGNQFETRVRSLETGAVMLTNAQTITGVKTFNALPQSGVTPTTANQLTRKGYVDNLVTTSVNNIRQTLATVTIPTTGWTATGGYYTRSTGVTLPSGTNGNTIDLYIPRQYLGNLVSWISVDNVSGTIYISSGAIPTGQIIIYMTFKQTT